jgi:hypothetical protein
LVFLILLIVSYKSSKGPSRNAWYKIGRADPDFKPNRRMIYSVAHRTYILSRTKQTLRNVVAVPNSAFCFSRGSNARTLS